MAASQVSVGAAIRYAWSLLSVNWRAVWGALALNALAATVYAAGLYSQNGLLILGAFPAMLMTALMVNGALFRLAFADRRPHDTNFRPGHHGLQWGRIEWRLLGAHLLVLGFMTLIMLLAVIAIGAVLAGLSWAGVVRMPEAGALQAMMLTPGARPDPVILAPLVVLIALSGYVRTRLALALPATVDQGAVRVLRTWRLTKGRVWPIVASVLFVALPVMILTAYVTRNLITPNGMQTDAGPTAILIAALTQGVADGLFLTPMIAGVCAYFYRALSQDAPVAPVVPPVEPRP